MKELSLNARRLCALVMLLSALGFLACAILGICGVLGFAASCISSVGCLAPLALMGGLVQMGTNQKASRMDFVLAALLALVALLFLVLRLGGAIT